jgi:hypothetical protein
MKMFLITLIKNRLAHVDVQVNIESAEVSDKQPRLYLKLVRVHGE